MWYPVRELEGLGAANDEAAAGISVDAAKGTVRVAFNATSERKGVRAVLAASGDPLRIRVDEKADIAPDRPWAREVPLPPGIEAGALEARLEAGTVLLVSCRIARPRGAPRPEAVRPPPPPE